MGERQFSIQELSAGGLAVLAVVLVSLINSNGEGALPTVCFLNIGNCGGPISGISSSQAEIDASRSGSSGHAPQSTSSSQPTNLQDIYLQEIVGTIAILDSMPPEMLLQFPIGSDSALEVVGYVDHVSGRVLPLTPQELSTFLDANASRLYVQASGEVPDDREMLDTLDIVVFDNVNREHKFVSSIDAGDFLRDAVESTIQGSLRELEVDISDSQLALEGF